MNTRTLALLTALTTVAFCAAGCGPKQASSPTEAIRLMAEAVEEGDREQFVAQYDAEGKEKEALGATFGMMTTMQEFNEKMKDTYGDAFPAPSMKHFKPSDVEKAEVNVDGDTATVKVPGQAGEMKLVKKDGGWKIKPGAMLRDDLDQQIKHANASRKAIEAVMPLIGKEGETVQSIQAELGKARMKEMGVDPGNMPSGPELDTLVE
jgi:hypothetical protein